MKERPIIMLAESVRAILDGRKTQTRRVIKPQPNPDNWNWNQYADGAYPCPYGQPGDRLWVRETWTEIEHGRKAMYRVDIGKYVEQISWTSPRFMPRWASRITLEVTGVRVERVSNISEADAIAEGLTRRGYWWDVGNDWVGDGLDNDPVGAFAKLWDRINARRGYSWESNCWVWVIEFKVV